MNYKQITAAIINIEQNLNLFSVEENGVFIWKMARMQVMDNLITKVNNISSVHGLRENKDKLLNSLLLFINSVIDNPFTINKNKENIFFENPRKTIWNNVCIDPYTHFFIKELSNYHVIEGVYKSKLVKSVHNPSSPINLLLLMSKLREVMLRKISFSENTINTLKKVERNLKSDIGIEVPVAAIALKQYKTFLATYSVYDALFKMKKWNKIHLVCSYGKEPIIAAAQKNNIRVYELQHGTLGPYHLGYHFPNTDNVPYFPDEFLLFGEFWSDITSLPSYTKAKYIGHLFLNEQLKYYKQKIDEKQNQAITVISQGTIGKQLSEFMLEVIRRLSDFRFQYKLHPGEFKRWKQEYPALVELSNFNNVSIYEDEKPLYEMLAESKYTIGVYSTALFEAIAFQSNPIIIKLPGYEYMNDYRNQCRSRLFDKPNELMSYLLNNSYNTEKLNDSNYYFYGSYI